MIGNWQSRGISMRNRSKRNRMNIQINLQNSRSSFISNGTIFPLTSRRLRGSMSSSKKGWPIQYKKHKDRNRRGKGSKLKMFSRCKLCVKLALYRIRSCRSRWPFSVLSCCGKSRSETVRLPP